MSEDENKTKPCDHTGIGRPGCTTCDPLAEEHRAEGWIPSNRQDDHAEQAGEFATLTEEQTREREDIVKAIGQRCNALMRYDGKDPALVASALLWCGLSMYAQASEITREGILVVCGSTFDEAKQFLSNVQAAQDLKKAKENLQAIAEGIQEGLEGKSDGQSKK